MTLQFILIFQAIQAISLAIIAMCVYKWWASATFEIREEMKTMGEFEKDRKEVYTAPVTKKYRATVYPETQD